MFKKCLFNWLNFYLWKKFFKISSLISQFSFLIQNLFIRFVKLTRRGFVNREMICRGKKEENRGRSFGNETSFYVSEGWLFPFRPNQIIPELIQRQEVLFARWPSTKENLIKKCEKNENPLYQNHHDSCIDRNLLKEVEIGRIILSSSRPMILSSRCHVELLFLLN